MFSISIPVWLLSVCVGFPTLTLLTLVISLLRNKRRRTRKEDVFKEDGLKEVVNRMPHQAQNHFIDGQNNALRYSENIRQDDSVHQMILDMQIDAVFQSLSMIIETEKVKLKALIGTAGAYMPHTGLEGGQRERGSDQGQDGTKQSEAITEHQNEFEIADQIAEMAADGVTPKIIAKRLGLSLSEVVLAIRMKQNAVDDTGEGYGLKAIA